jgi:hypothetical protein
MQLILWLEFLVFIIIFGGGLLLLFCLPDILFFRRRNLGLAKKLLLTGAVINAGLGVFLLQHALHNIDHSVAFRGGSGDTVMLAALCIDVVCVLVAATK